MMRFTLLILILFSLLAGSCSTRKNKVDNKNLIPEKELVSILTDAFIADGLLTLPKIHYLYSSLDSLSAYIQIIERHGYTKAAMDKTLKYYFIKKPKQLIVIYDQVLGVLSEMESRYEREGVLLQSSISNIWKGKEFFCFPDIKGADSTRFSIPIKKPGYYTLTFSATVFPDDQSVNPQITAYTCNLDSLATGKRIYAKTINYLKDGRPHIYTLVFKVPEKTQLLLRGWLYNFCNNPDNSEKHAIFENISLTFSSGIV
jgi:hypothetical protein